MRLGLPPARDQYEPPLTTMWLPTIESPLIPIPIHALQKGARAALNVIESGGIVYTHCSKGRHRGPAMGACILIAQGMDPEQAMQLIKENGPLADPHAWYIRKRIMKFERLFQ